MELCTFINTVNHSVDTFNNEIHTHTHDIKCGKFRTMKMIELIIWRRLLFIIYISFSYDLYLLLIFLFAIPYNYLLWYVFATPRSSLWKVKKKMERKKAMFEQCLPFNCRTMHFCLSLLRIANPSWILSCFFCSAATWQPTTEHLYKTA